MAAYRWVYDSRHLQADYQEPGSAPEPFAQIEYGLPLNTFFTSHIVGCWRNYVFGLFVHLCMKACPLDTFSDLLAIDF